jgi:hypothetical protein
MRLPDPVRVQRDTHHLACVGPFRVEHIELVFDHLAKVRRVPVQAQHPAVVGLEGVRHVNELVPVFDFHRKGLVVARPIGVVQQPELGHHVRGIH